MVGSLELKWLAVLSLKNFALRMTLHLFFNLSCQIFIIYSFA